MNKMKNNKLFMLCGTHGSDKKEDECEVPDLVWPKEKRFLIREIGQTGNTYRFYLQDKFDYINRILYVLFVTLP